MLPASTRESIAFDMTSFGSTVPASGVGLGWTTAIGRGVGVGSGGFEHAKAMDTESIETNQRWQRLSQTDAFA